MKSRFFPLFGLALVACLTTSLVAQDEGGGRGGRGGGGPGGQRGFGGPGGPGGMMGGMMGGGASELLGLLRIEEVRKEIELDEESLQAIETAQQDLMAQARGMRDMTPEQRAEKMKEMNSAAQDLLDEALQPEQQKRLMGLLVQRNGNRAAMNEVVAKEIGLEEKEIDQVREAATEARGDMRERFQALRGGDGERPDFSKMQEMMEEIYKDVDKAIAAKLSEEQLKALEALKGEKFEFPQRAAFGGRGAGGPGARDGRPGGRPERGNRPGNDN